MGKYIMALDAGTTSNRCILFIEIGERCSVAQREFTQYFPKPGWVDHDADEIWASMLGVAVESMSKIGADASQIAAIGMGQEYRRTCLSCHCLAVPQNFRILRFTESQRPH